MTLRLDALAERGRVEGAEGEVDVFPQADKPQKDFFDPEALKSVVNGWPEQAFDAAPLEVRLAWKGAEPIRGVNVKVEGSGRFPLLRDAPVDVSRGDVKMGAIEVRAECKTLRALSGPKWLGEIDVRRRFTGPTHRLPIIG